MQNVSPKAKILLVGKSGSGKNTVQDYLVNKYGLKPLVSYTTRKKRYPLEDTHNFISLQEFVDMKWHEDFIAYTFFNNNHYFATRKQFEEADVYIIDVNGVKYIKELGITTPYIVVYLDVPSHVRAERMAQRGDSPNMINERIQHDESAFNGIEKLCNYFIDNDNSEETADTIAELVGLSQRSYDDMEVEKEIISKLCQIQTLLRGLNSNIDRIDITLLNCCNAPLKKDNDFGIACLDKSLSKELIYLGTANDEEGKRLYRTSYGLPNKARTSVDGQSIDIKSVRID